jgi:antitoxin (DNA-binding transcriptional repressor) of toxin-antitoxin stability system
MSKRKFVTVGVTEFKRRCLGLIADVEAGRIETLALTRRGRQVAQLTRLQPRHAPARLWGSMAGTIRIPEGVDLTAPTGETWNALNDEAA